MPYTRTGPFTNGAAPALSATTLNTLEDNIAAITNRLEDRLGVGGIADRANKAAIDAIPTAELFPGRRARAADTGYVWEWSGAPLAWRRYGVDTSISEAFTASTGWSIGSQEAANIQGWLAYVWLTFTRTGAAITVPADGDVSNIQMASTNTGWRALASTGFVVRNNILAAVEHYSSGGLYLASVSPGATIPTGRTFSLGGFYLLSGL